MGDLVYLSATALAKAIRHKQLSSLEVIDAHVERIQKVNPAINAVVQLESESARTEARKADAEQARGNIRGPLHGVAFTVKDAFETAGVVSTGGTLGRASFVPVSDATVVARLKAAGAILLGKTNVPDLSLAWESDNLVYGRTNNPYDLERTPGGSSGGEASIIAAGGSPLGLGSDAGGSIRAPAHFCGIAGIKPTSGRVPRTGHWPRFNGLVDSWTQVGPMARSVEDLAITLPIISGADWRDPHVIPMPLGNPEGVALKGLRVAFFTDNGIKAADHATAQVVEAAAKSLADAGVAVEQACPAVLTQSYGLFLASLRADGGSGVREVLAAAGSRQANVLMGKYLKIKAAAPMSGAQLCQMLVELDEFRGAMTAFMETRDAIICPVHATPAPYHGTTFEVVPDFSYTYQFNQTGWPAAVVRGGTSPEGLPIGVQVAARPWREDVALALAHHLETALGGWQPPPL